MVLLLLVFELAHDIRSLTLCILMDSPINIDTISMELPIVYLKGSQVEFSEL